MNKFQKHLVTKLALQLAFEQVNHGYQKGGVDKMLIGRVLP